MATTDDEDRSETAACPECDKARIYWRKGTDDYRCRDCGHSFDEPVEREVRYERNFDREWPDDQHNSTLNELDPDVIQRTIRCGCIGCHDEAAYKIRHPDHGRRVVCEAHRDDHPIIEEVEP